MPTRTMLPLFVAAILAASDSHALVLCARNRAGEPIGSIRIRDACRPAETPVDPVALGLQGPVGPLGPEGPQGEQGPPGPAPADMSARVYNSTDIDVPDNGTPLNLTFDSERFDTANLHDASTPSRLTAPVPGKYLVYAHVSWKTNGTGWRILNLVRNGNLTLNVVIADGSANRFIEQTAITHIDLAAGDYVEAVVGHNAGSTIQIATSPPGMASTLHFGMVKLP